MNKLVIPLLVALFSACGRAPEPSSLASVERAGAPVLAVMTGFNTCGPGRTPRTADIIEARVDAIVRGYEESFGTSLPRVLSCYDGLTSDSIRFVSGRDGGVSELPWDDASSLAGELSHQVAAADADRVVVVGYSYGGWLAMQTTAQLLAGARPNLQVDLVTIDPISPLQCAQGGVALGGLRSLFGFGGTRGCNTSPQDVDSERLATAVSSWQNYYQTAFPLIHSEAIAGAKNHWRDLRNGLHWGGAHEVIGKDATAWETVRALLGTP